jgi:putative phage-type endonuclease
MSRLPILDRLHRLDQVRQYEQRTPEWYEVRRGLMTASNAASALGIKPFASFTGDVKRDAIENIVHRKFKGNVATRHGVKYEDEVREKFDKIMHRTTREYGLIVHADVHGPETGLPWLAASPDGITNLYGEMLEIKCPWRRQIVPGEVPHHYFPQIQTQLEVCDLEVCYFVGTWKTFMCCTVFLNRFISRIPHTPPR